MRKQLWCALLAALFLITLFSACKNDQKDVYSKESDSHFSEESETESKSEFIGESEMDTTDTSSAASSNSNSTSASSAGTSSRQPQTGTPVTLNVKDYGAKGDGKTDDAQAIFKAVLALRASPPGSILNFEANKTYYCKNNGMGIAQVFFFNGDSGLTVRGNNCLIKVGGKSMTYGKIENCKDFVMEGFNFDYAEYKPAFAAKVESVDLNNYTAVVTADRDIHLSTGEVYQKLMHDWFGQIAVPQTGRYYLYVEKYEMLDAAARKIRVYFGTAINTRNSLARPDVFTYGMVLPMPETGNHMGSISEGIGVRDNTNVTMRNIKIYSVARHGIPTTRNEGTVLFENVNFVRAPYDQNLMYTSWGDIWHTWNNRADVIWKNCKCEFNYDDVINMFTITQFITKKYSNTEFTLKASAMGVVEARPGDTFRVINLKTGKFGRAAVTSFVRISDTESRVKISAPISAAEPAEDTTLAWFEETLGGPNSAITGCDFEGTLRLNGRITVSNSKLFIRRLWTGIETIKYEGPLAFNLLFKNCELSDSGDANDKVYGFNSRNSVKEGYRLENIVFEKCRGISMDRIDKGPYDEVIIK